jgi:hypothetical protein
LTTSKHFLGLAAAVLAIMLVAWLLVLQIEEFTFW